MIAIDGKTLRGARSSATTAAHRLVALHNDHRRRPRPTRGGCNVRRNSRPARCSLAALTLLTCADASSQPMRCTPKTTLPRRSWPQARTKHSPSKPTGPPRSRCARSCPENQGPVGSQTTQRGHGRRAATHTIKVILTPTLPPLAPDLRRCPDRTTAASHHQEREEERRRRRPAHLRHRPCCTSRSPGILGTRPLGHREQAPLSARRNLQRGPLPSSHRRWSPRHGKPAQHRPESAAPGRSPRHRHRKQTSFTTPERAHMRLELLRCDLFGCPENPNFGKVRVMSGKSKRCPPESKRSVSGQFRRPLGARWSGLGPVRPHRASPTARLHSGAPSNIRARAGLEPPSPSPHMRV